MLKGHVFSKQLFGNPIFALFINTFLNGANGVSNNFKNGMAVTYNGSNVSIDSGAVCIQGRFLEEDSLTTLPAGTNSAYCKLVIEIDLDKQNTESEFNQASYKIITSTSAYPNLTQTNIVKNNSGVYQYELARFRTGTNGITEFQDMRTFLDFDSIYNAIETEYQSVLNELKQELASVEDGSAYVLKNDIVVINGIIEMPASGSGLLGGSAEINYPNGFTSKNSVVIGIMGHSTVHEDWWSTTADGNLASSYLLGSANLVATLKPNNITISSSKLGDETPGNNVAYKLILMKTPQYTKNVDYILGDVNGDGEITQDDADMVLSYTVGDIALTDKQWKAADANEDGEVTTLDAAIIQRMISQ